MKMEALDGMAGTPLLFHGSSLIGTRTRESPKSFSIANLRIAREEKLRRSSSSTSPLKPKAVRVRAGLPVVSAVPVIGPLVNVLLSPLVVLAIYAFGAARFLRGFSSTTYRNTLPTKLALTLAWPVLLLVSDAYRSNFKKAISK